MQFRKLLGLLTAKRWVWKAAIAGLCGNLTHTLLMLGKAKLGILKSFQPYQSLQIALSHSTGEYIHPLVPWLLSYLNGSTAAGFIFANLYHHLPGNSGPVKGFIAGVLGWLVMDIIFFPLLGLGPFAMHVGLGFWPALFSLGMMLAYSIVLGLVYSMIDAGPDLTARAQRHPSPGRLSSKSSPLRQVAVRSPEHRRGDSPRFRGGLMADSVRMAVAVRAPD